jgi:hypothetical protein
MKDQGLKYKKLQLFMSSFKIKDLIAITLKLRGLAAKFSELN